MIQRFSIIAMLSLALFLSASLALAQPNNDPYGTNTTANAAGFPQTNDQDTKLNDIIAGIIRTLLGLTGVLFMGLIIYAGNLWMTAGGNEEQIKNARSMIVNAAIGIVVIFAAYVLTTFVVDTILGLVEA